MEYIVLTRVDKRLTIGYRRTVSKIKVPVHILTRDLYTFQFNITVPTRTRY